MRFAAAKGKELYVLSQSSGSSLPDVSQLEWEGEAIKTATVTTTNPFRTISDLVAELKPELLMLDDANDHPEQHTNFINQAINEISCEVLVVRLGEGDHDGGIFWCHAVEGGILEWHCEWRIRWLEWTPLHFL